MNPGDEIDVRNGYANKTLWPLFHYRIDLAAFDRAFGEGYSRVNRRFAQTLAPLIEPDDVIWVHDYHLIPLARELRSLGGQEPDRLLPAHPVAGASGDDKPAASPRAGGGDVRL